MYEQVIRQVLDKHSCQPVASQEGYTSLCPFHDDQHSSFAIRASDGLYICYAQQCGARGNIHSFLRKAGGYSFEQATRLAEHVPVVAPKTPARMRAYGERRPRTETAPETEATVYAALCPRYMVERGFDKKTLRHFEVGFDTTRRHVMIPVRGVRKELLGFVRRAIDPNEQPRYLIDVVRGRRGGILFNMHHVVELNAEYVVIVEGALDCMWLHQAGVPNVVALLGTTLSRAQEILLKRSFDTFVLMLDNDVSGRVATEKYVERLSKHGTVEVAADFPEGKDAADNEPSAVVEALENRVYGPLWQVRTNLEFTGRT